MGGSTPSDSVDTSSTELAELRRKQEAAEKKAEELKVKRITFITNRDEKVINRKMGKFGYRKTCSVWEKEIKDV